MRSRALVSLCSVLVFSLFFSFSPLRAVPIPEHFRFDSFTTEDGLANSSVSRIIQDRDGIIWIATQAGLNKFDGYTFTHYEHDPFDENSLSHNLVQTMYLDGDGSLWVGTYGGLNHFDPVSDTFTRYINVPGDDTSLSNNIVTAVSRDTRGTLWVGTLGGLNRFNEEAELFVRYLPGQDRERSLANGVVRDFMLDLEGNLWIGTNGGLCLYSYDSDDFTVYRHDPEIPDSLPSPYVMTMIQNPEDPERFWVGTWGGGVSEFHIPSGSVRDFDLPKKEVYRILHDSRGRLWIGTWGGGLIVLNPRNENLVHVTASSQKSSHGAFFTTLVYSLMEDSSGMIWIGTNGGGINTYEDWKKPVCFHNP